ncbi:MAG: hypothetical protein JXO44_10230 [Clostridia bacterium]|nr:hypothetical protein [Clostridia bacterium]
MDQTSKNTLNFCIEFIKNNFTERSQISMCLVWLKQAIELLEKETDLSSGMFIVNELGAIEAYLIGKDTSSTSADVISKIQMIETLLKDL